MEHGYAPEEGTPTRTSQLRRAADATSLTVHLFPDRATVEVAEGWMTGSGFNVFLDAGRTAPLAGDDRRTVLPGVFLTRVAGVAFHDDVLQRPEFGAGRPVEIRPEPANATDRHALAVYGGGRCVGYLPERIAADLAPAGTRSGRGLVVREWTMGGLRHGIWILGSMQVRLDVRRLA